MWTVASGIVTLLLVATLLNAEQQGIYYTFYSLIALQVLAELGLHQAIINFASHEFAHLTWQGQTLSGPARAKARLRSLFRSTTKWFVIAATMFSILIGAAGCLFFYSTIDSWTTIVLPWLLLVFSSSAVLLLNTALAFIEGSGRVQDVFTYRLIFAVVSGLSCWGLLVLDIGMMSFGIANCIGFAAACLLTAKRHWHFFSELNQKFENELAVIWSVEVWPFQWRLAVSWVSGYLIFNLFNPLLMLFVGPEAAGRYGVAMQVMTVLSNTAMIWITAKVSRLSRLAAMSKGREIDQLLLPATIRALAFVSIGGLVVCLGVYALIQMENPYASRFASVEVFAILLMGYMANIVVYAEAVYLRAHKEEPFVTVSVATGLVTATTSLFLIPSLGELGAAAAFLIGALIPGLGFGTLVFVKKRKQWSLGWKTPD